MDGQKFEEVSREGIAMLRAALSGVAPGETIVYNAYIGGMEVAVLGYQYPAEDGIGTLTRPLGILITDEVFNSLRVDQESGRVGTDGAEEPPKVL